jgi:hypothetical protein
MTSVAGQLREYLDDHGVEYRIIPHEVAASADEYHAILGTRYEQMPKASFSATRARPGRASRSSRCRLTSARTCNVSGECVMHATYASVAVTSFGR